MPGSPPRHKRIKDVYAERFALRRHRLSPGLMAVAQYIDGNRHAVLGLSALEIGFETGTSDATVIRAIQALGFSGLRDLKDTLDAWLGETDSPVEKMASTARELGGDCDAAIDFVIDSQRRTLEALAEPENRAAMAAAVRLMAGADGICVFGIGASGIIADYAARLFTRSGLPGRALNATGVALGEQLLGMRAGQVLLMLLHGRAHREATSTVSEAQRLGLPIVMILGRGDTPLRVHAAASIVMPRAKSDRVALHAPGLVTVEAMHLALSAATPERTVGTLDRLVALRGEIRPHSR